MKKYTQRELHNEAFRDILKTTRKAFRNSTNDKAKGVGKVLAKGALGAVKKVGKYISPEIYGLAKGAKGIYDKEQSKKAIISHISHGRPVQVYKNTVSADSIITSRHRQAAPAVGQAAASDIDNLRLHDPDDINIIERRGGITISSFKATNYTTQAEEPFIAYIFRDEEAEGDYKVFALQHGGNPAPTNPAPTNPAKTPARPANPFGSGAPISRRPYIS